MSDRIIGDGSMNAPFEPEPTNDAVPLGMEGAMLAAGVVCMAAAYDVPGAGHCPAIIFRFSAPEGVMYPPMILILDPQDAPHLGTLVTDATNAAIARAEELRESA